MTKDLDRDSPKLSATVSRDALNFLDGEWAGAGSNKGKTRSYCLNRLILYVKLLFEKEYSSSDG